MGSLLTILLVLLIVAGLIGGGIWLSIALAKRAGRGGPLASVKLPGKDEHARAGAELVQVDEQLREAKQEADFAAATLGETQLATVQSALAEADATMAKAFDLKRQLDSATVEPAAKAGLTEQIYVLAGQVRGIVTEQLGTISSLKKTAEGLDEDDQLAALSAQILQRADAAQSTTAQLSVEFSPEVAREAEDELAQARELVELAAKSREIAAQRQRGGQLDQAAEPLRAARQALQRADAIVGEVEAMPQDLVEAQLALSSTLEQAQTEAKAITDGSHASDSDAAAALADLNALLAKLPLSGKSGNPVHDLEAVRAAQARLGHATGSVAKAPMTPAQARSALSGTLMAAKQHIGAVDDAIAARPASIKAEVRVKVAEARRLVQQAQETASSDPVAAIELAWQADQAAAAAHQGL